MEPLYYDLADMQNERSTNERLLKACVETAKDTGLENLTVFALGYIIRHPNDYSKETVKEAELLLMHRQMGV